MTAIKQAKKEKKLYKKPQITEVQLVAEEAVLATCKDNTGMGGQTACGVQGDTNCISQGRS